MRQKQLMAGSIAVALIFGLWISGSLRAADEGGEPTVPEATYNQPAGNGTSPPIKTVIDLQPYRKTAAIDIHDNAGHKGVAALINLNPQINSWFVLAVHWGQDDATAYYHLENRRPESTAIGLDPGYPLGLVIADEKGNDQCPLWAEPDGGSLARAVLTGEPYSSLCGERLWLRNPTVGHKTALETVTDLLRQHVWQGEKITAFVRETFFKDAFLNTAPVIVPRRAIARRSAGPGAPVPPLVDAAQSGHLLEPAELGIKLESETGDRLMIGRWYPVKGLAGVYVSVLQPDMVAAAVMESTRRQVNAFDEVEGQALVYMVAFDLDRFDLGFEMGTEHPGVGWSDRVPAEVRDNALPGPDGIGNLAPLAMTGLLNPDFRPRVAAAFAGGFKRYHGAFRWSALSRKNQGSHYGFLEYGTILSRLQPDLATILTYADGSVDMVTWQAGDEAQLAHIQHARQNGVPIIDYDAATGISKVGAMVPRWGQGNWSGSVDERQRTVRAGLALQESAESRFLLFGYFSAATPSAMARVFTAFQCKYAMLLDINALEHTYLAVYPEQAGQPAVEHLIKGMHVLDKVKDGRVLRRFVDFPDNRDFFYLLKKESS